MAALKTLGDLLNSSEWTEALVQEKVATTGSTDSFLKAAHVTPTWRAHQVTASSLYFLQNVFSQGGDEGQDLED